MDEDTPSSKRRKKLGDIELTLKTEAWSTTFRASRLLLSMKSPIFENMFNGPHKNEEKTCVIHLEREKLEDGPVVTLLEEEPTLALLEFLHSDTSGLSHIGKRPWEFKLKFLMTADYFHVSIPEAKTWPSTLEEAKGLLAKCPAFVGNPFLHIGLRGYIQLGQIEDLTHLHEVLQRMKLPAEANTTLLLRCWSRQPDAQFQISLAKVSGTYVRGVVLAYVIKYPHIRADILEAINNSRKGLTPGLDHGMVWGIPFRKDGNVYAPDLVWLGLDKLYWTAIGIGINCLTKNGIFKSMVTCPLVFDECMPEFSD
jgi:hypothetical protein